MLLIAGAVFAVCSPIESSHSTQLPDDEQEIANLRGHEKPVLADFCIQSREAVRNILSASTSASYVFDLLAEYPIGCSPPTAPCFHCQKQQVDATSRKKLEGEAKSVCRNVIELFAKLKGDLAAKFEAVDESVKESMERPDIANVHCLTVMKLVKASNACL